MKNEPVLTKEKVKWYEVTDNHQGQRLDNFLIAHLKGVPKTHLYRLLRKGQIRVNKKRAQPSYRLQVNDLIRVAPLRVAASQAENKLKPSATSLDYLSKQILYEDDNLLILNKPVGMAVHGGSGLSFGVIEAMRQLRPQAKFLELVHRLDRETSGCLMLAKKSSVLRQLHELLREGTITKTYWALVKGRWPKEAKQVEAPLHKFQLQSGERLVKVNREQGKSSVTLFKVIKYFPEVTLVEARPLTGRTHQIRVHALHQGHPIVSDEKYGDKEFNKHMQKQGCKRLMLHAYSLDFTLPSTSQHIQVTAPSGEVWQNFIA